MLNLTKLSNKYGCDKSDAKHRYTKLYQARFDEIRKQKFNMMEFGYGQGASTRMWLEYFPNIKLFVVDKDPIKNPTPLLKYIKNGRLVYIEASQLDSDSIFKVIKDNKFFIVIDDCSHVAEDEQFTMNFMFPRVVSGGWYVIEDLLCPRSHNKSFGVEADLTIDMLKIYNKTKRFQSKILTMDENLAIEKDIDNIKIYKKIAFIRKK